MDSIAPSIRFCKYVYVIYILHIENTADKITAGLETKKARYCDCDSLLTAKNIAESLTPS